MVAELGIRPKDLREGNKILFGFWKKKKKNYIKQNPALPYRSYATTQLNRRALTNSNDLSPKGPETTTNATKRPAPSTVTPSPPFKKSKEMTREEARRHFRSAFHALHSLYRLFGADVLGTPPDWGFGQAPWTLDSLPDGAIDPRGESTPGLPPDQEDDDRAGVPNTVDSDEEDGVRNDNPVYQTQDVFFLTLVEEAPKEPDATDAVREAPTPPALAMTSRTPSRATIRRRQWEAELMPVFLEARAALQGEREVFKKTRRFFRDRGIPLTEDRYRVLSKLHKQLGNR